MAVNEEQLRQLVYSILKELEAEQNGSGKQENRQKLYMVCTSGWDQRYQEFLDQMDQTGMYEIIAVIPDQWQQEGYEALLKQHDSCRGIRYYSSECAADLREAATVFPVTDRNTIVKTALCIRDTFETSWIADCVEQGGRIMLLRSGLQRFSGREPCAYMEQILNYYRTVLTYGIEICGFDDIKATQMHNQATVQEGRGAGRLSRKNKRVITVSNMEQFVSGGMIVLEPGDIVTDLAKEQAERLHITIK